MVLRSIDAGARIAVSLRRHAGLGFQEARASDIVALFERNPCPLCAGARNREFATIGHRRIAQCTTCDFLFADRFDPAALERAYVDEYYASKEDERIESWVEANRGVWDGLCATLEEHAPKPKTVLDVGAGTGGFLLEYHRRNPMVDLHAIESSRNARASLSERLPGVHFLDVEAIDLAAGGARFDVVTLLQTLEHLVEPARVCRAIHASLRPGGMLLVTVPNRRSYAVSLHGMNEKECFGNVTHLQFFEKRTLERMLSEAGFSRVHRAAGFGGSNVGSAPLKLAQYALRLAGRSKELRYLAWK